MRRGDDVGMDKKKEGREKAEKGVHTIITGTCTVDGRR